MFTWPLIANLFNFVVLIQKYNKAHANITQ